MYLQITVLLHRTTYQARVKEGVMIRESGGRRDVAAPGDAMLDDQTENLISFLLVEHVIIVICSSTSPSNQPHSLSHTSPPSKTPPLLPHLPMETSLGKILLPESQILYLYADDDEDDRPASDPISSSSTSMLCLRTYIFDSVGRCCVLLAVRPLHLIRLHEHGLIIKSHG